MITQLSDLSLVGGVIPITLAVLCVAAFLFVVIRSRASRWAPIYAVAAAVGTGIGFLIAWWLGDVEDAFDVTLTFATRAWFALGTAGVLVGAVSLYLAHGWRISAGIAMILVFALAGGLGVNASVGEFPTVGSLVGSDAAKSLALPAFTGETSNDGALWRTWRAPSDLPAFGEVTKQKIPATYSHFATTDAIIYLPPAALVSNAPALPVMVFLGGQPGSPQTVIDSGEMPELMNAFAAKHDGLAPIVVIPDQLGAPQDNPMCLNSPLGNVKTYITRDVTDWIRTHLNVLSGRKYWAIGGFSEGGTCSIQLGTQFSSTFGDILDISGQVAPVNGTPAATIKKAFDGSAAAYAAASPLSLLKSGAPFTKTLGIFAVGQDDSKYGPDTGIIEHAAEAAGMDVHSFVSVGTAHDWYTERYGVKVGLPLLATRMGLTS